MMTSILFVEDHRIFAQALQRVLHERGHMDVVAVAESVEESLNLIPSLDREIQLGGEKRFRPVIFRLNPYSHDGRATSPRP